MVRLVIKDFFDEIIQNEAVAIPAQILAFVPLLMSIMVSADMERWINYAIIYVVSGILALGFMALVYIARDFNS